MADAQAEQRHGPLTAEQRRQVGAVVEAYGAFWDNIKFRQGWEKPLFTRQQVEDLLREAAEIVVRIRSELDAEDSGMKLRLIEGSAKEFLWQFVRNPQKHPKAFVRGLVHATLSDANGYVEGLTKDRVDDFIESVKGYWSSQDDPDEDAIASLRRKWEQANERMIAFLNNANSARACEDRQGQLDLKKIRASLKTISAALSDMESRFSETQAGEASSMQVDEESNEAVSPESMDVDESEGGTSGSEDNPLPDLKKNEAVELEISKISDDVNAIRSEIQKLTSNAATLDMGSLKEDPVSGAKVLEDLNRAAMKYSEELMRELLALDAVSVTQEYRPIRKAQVNTVQELLRDVDSIRSKLQTMKDEIQIMKRQREEEETKRFTEQKRNEELQRAECERQRQEDLRRQREGAEQVRQDHQQQEDDEDAQEENEEDADEDGPTDMSIVPHQQESVWRQLKFKPDFDVRETSDSYLIRGLIPGMDPAELKVVLTNNNRELVLSGYREPSPQELAIMKKKLASLQRHDRYGHYYPEGLDEQSLLLRLGGGKFGHFQTRYEVPYDADPAKIQAKYEGGVLSVVIPRKLQPRMRHQYPLARYPQRSVNRGSYGGLPYFFNNGDYF